jgi:ABC-type proline/glycine betaine transport system ATPase subunit
VAGELASGALSARVRLERRAPHSSFVLDVSIEVPAGITVLFGPSGAGKSTLLDCIAGLLHPNAGRIAVGEKTLFDSDTRVNLRPQKRGIAYVFQSLALFPRMTVEENVAYGLAICLSPSASRGFARSSLHFTWRRSVRADPTKFPEAKSSAWPWQGRLSLSRKCCCWMSPSALWIHS